MTNIQTLIAEPTHNIDNNIQPLNIQRQLDHDEQLPFIHHLRPPQPTTLIQQTLPFARIHNQLDEPLIPTHLPTIPTTIPIAIQPSQEPIQQILSHLPILQNEP